MPVNTEVPLSVPILHINILLQTLQARSHFVSVELVLCSWGMFLTNFMSVDMPLFSLSALDRASGQASPPEHRQRPSNPF
jgi:hypothetical protein